MFVASPGDLFDERNLVEEEVRFASEEGARSGVQLDCFRWEEDTTPGLERRLQERASREVRSAELTIVMFWYRLGSAASLTGSETATAEELRVAGEQVANGYADDVFVYFKQATPPMGVDPADVAAVRAFRQRLATQRQQNVADFLGLDDLRTRLRRDLARWARRWFAMRDVCAYLLRGSEGAMANSQHLGESCLTRLNSVWEPVASPELERAVGRIACSAYQTLGPTAFQNPLRLSRRAADEVQQLCRPHLRSGQLPFRIAGYQLTFDGAEWFFLCCALGLIDAIGASRVDAVTTRPYVNPVHQLLSALAAQRRLVGHLADELRRWLRNDGDLTSARPVARNFAAYVLGMIGAIDAQDDLAMALAHDPDASVRLYCITSLGKLRARRYLETLLERFRASSDAVERDTTAKALCRMTGLAHFEL